MPKYRGVCICEGSLSSKSDAMVEFATPAELDAFSRGFWAAAGNYGAGDAIVATTVEELAGRGLSMDEAAEAAAWLRAAELDPDMPVRFCTPDGNYGVFFPDFGFYIVVSESRGTDEFIGSLPEDVVVIDRPGGGR